MAERGFRDRLKMESGRWVSEGIVTPDQARRIVGLYPEEAEGPREEGWAANVLHAAAGVLIGAAVLALVFVGLEPKDPTPLLFAFGILLALGGAALVALVPRRAMVGDAILVASLVPLSFIGTDPTTLILGWIAAAVALAYIVWRHRRVFVQTTAVIAFSILVPTTLDQYLFGDVDRMWVVAQAGLLVLLVAVDRFLRQEDGIVPTAAAIVALAVSSALFFEEVVEQTETIEILLGVAMIALIAIGIPLRHRGLVTGAVIVLSVDAIVFAFDAGNVITGIVVLLGVAAVLLWQGERVRGYFRER
ncbi:MAG: DUF2157 domain-containing protein [Euryarchaeota archaeon]|nr:DUF2157 domain-containing protein [Euryarchaeota archaeon]